MTCLQSADSRQSCVTLFEKKCMACKPSVTKHQIFPCENPRNFGIFTFNRDLIGSSHRLLENVLLTANCVNVSLTGDAMQKSILEVSYKPFTSLF